MGCALDRVRDADASIDGNVWVRKVVDAPADRQREDVSAGPWADEVAKDHRGQDLVQWRKGGETDKGPSRSLSAGVPEAVI